MARILISVDHKWRDLPAYTVVAMMLERLGNEVMLVRHGFEIEFATVFKPQFALLIHVASTKQQRVVSELSNRGVGVGLMPSEGFPTLREARGTFSGVDHDLSKIDRQYCWGNGVATLLQSNKTLKKGALKVVGCPRFDFYHSPFLMSACSRRALVEQLGFNPSVPIVTFATNFTQAQFHVSNKKFMTAEARDQAYDKVFDRLSVSGDGLIEIPRRDFESREILLESYLRLVRELDNIQFILKLHPSEEHSFYFDRLNKKDYQDLKGRLKIVTDSYIWKILQITDVEIKRSCTTGFEMKLLNKPTIELRLNPDEWLKSDEHAVGSLIVSDYNELKEAVLESIASSSTKAGQCSAQAQLIKKWFYKVDGMRCYELASDLDDLARRFNPRNFVLTFDLKWPGKFLSILKKIGIYWMLRLSDYRVHDLWLYRYSWILGNQRIDRLGRQDKYWNARDMVKLRNEYRESMNDIFKKI